MLKNLLAKLRAPKPIIAEGPQYRPYAAAHVNFLYNLLFCDNLELFRNDAARGEPWQTLFAAAPPESALRRIADDANAESRIRALAFFRLRQLGYAVPPKILLGVIVEMPQRGGLDALAAYADGRVRYLNHSGAASVFEGGPVAVETLARELVVAALPVVQRIGPWDRVRPPPPRGDAVRLNFLVSDGLYFGQGTFQQLYEDAGGRAVLDKAAELQTAVVDAALKMHGRVRA